MKNQMFDRSYLSHATFWLMLLAICTPALSADVAPDKTKSNYIIFSTTATDLNGSETAWRAGQQRTSNFNGGIEALHFETALQKNWFMSMDGKGILNEHDYSIELVFEQPGFNRTAFGFETFRTWSDARTVDITGISLIEPFDPSLALDRSKFFIETTFFPSDQLDLTLHYTLRQREGQKASTSWGDSGLSGYTRNVLPGYRDLDEIQHTVEFEAEYRGDNTTIDGALRWNHAETDNSLNMARGVGEATERYIEHAEDMESDTYTAHSSVEHRVSESLLLTMSAMFSRLDADVTGSRIFGDTIDNTIFGSANYISRYDHGFLDLAGDFDYDQYVATFGALYQPADNWFITPSIRFESTSQDASASETETGGATIHDDYVTESEKNYDSVAAEIGARYTGFTNWTLYADAFASYGKGDLNEIRYDTATPLDLEIDRDTDYERTTAKFTLGANWYAHRKATIAFQVYHRMNDNEYDHDSLNPNDYPAYITEHQIDTDSFNIRLNWRILPNLTSITRFDYQHQMIDAKAFDTSWIESGKRERFIYSESLNFQATQRLSLFGSINYVQDTLSTPASDYYSDQSTAVVAESRMDYITGQLTAMYAHNDTTDIIVTATGLLSDNYYNNSSETVPFGNDIEEFSVTASVSKWLDTNKRLTVEYGYYDYKDGATSASDYTAHLITAKYEYRF